MIDDPIHRTVSANTAPAVNRSGSAFDVLRVYAKPGAEEAPQEPTHTERPRKQRKEGSGVRTARSAGAQFKVACALLGAGEEGLEHQVIAERLEGVPAKALSNALGNMKVAGRVEKQRESQCWRLTEKGREWATGGANLMNQRAAGQRAVVEAKAPAKKARDLVTLPATQLVPARSSFRCYVASDGCFAMEKAGQKIELTLEETRQMVRYLDMVGEQLIEAATHVDGAANSHTGGPSEQRH